ncbi:MAG: hypothetical protein IJO99_03080 [Ruminococcus sp.]|nr:hypothetical protein [Ruminococcus sp.]MBR6791653.1 hypothetical protein [Ruminococcus sp.]
MSGGFLGELLLDAVLDVIDVFASSDDRIRGGRRHRRRYRNPKTELLREESKARESAMQATVSGMLDEIELRKQAEKRTEEMRETYVYEDDDASMDDISAVGTIAPCRDEENTEMDSI